jgi:hypothetical protein
MAREAAREARELEAAGKPGEARAKRAEAVDLFAKAETLFLAIPEGSPFREEALYTAGMCCYEALSLLSGKDRTEEELKAARECSARALGHFSDYKKFIKEHAPRSRSSDPAAAEQERREIEERRTRRLAAIDLTEPFIYFEIKEYTKALEAAEKLRERKDFDAALQEGLHQILFTCHVQVGLAQKDARKTAEHLAAAEKEVLWFKEQAAKAQGEDQVRLQRIYDRLEPLLEQIERLRTPGHLRPAEPELPDLPPAAERPALISPQPRG